MNYIFDNERPIYLQIVDIIRTKIVSGELKKGEKIPSVRDLAYDMKVNPNTMQKALVELEDEGLIFTERTNGKYVTENEKLIEKEKMRLAKEKVKDYVTCMKSIGISFEESIKILNEYGGKDGTC